MNTLRLEWKKREGNFAQTERNFLDFVIDDISLSEYLGDLVSGIGCFNQQETNKIIHRLLLKEPADFPDNRRSLYVCPECGDLGCGAISAVIEQSENEIIWRDFALEYNYSDDLTEYPVLGPYFFDKKSYEQVLKEFL